MARVRRHLFINLGLTSPRVYDMKSFTKCVFLIAFNGTTTVTYDQSGDGVNWSTGPNAITDGQVDSIDPCMRYIRFTGTGGTPGNALVQIEGIKEIQ